MENEQIADQMLAIISQLLQVAGPEWTMEFLQGGLEEAGAGGGQEQMPSDMPPEMMSQGGPGAMPPMAPMPSRGMMGRKIPGN